MKKVANAFKLYIKAAAHPFAIGFGMFIMIGMALIFIIDPDPVGSDDYLSMLASIQMGNIGTVFIVIVGNTKLQHNKFYSSCNCAKELFIISPVALVTVICALYDTLLAVSAYANLGAEGLSDTLILNTISSMQMIILGGCYGKIGIPILSVIEYIVYIGYIALPLTIKSEPVANSIIGHPLPTAFIFTVCGYILAIAGTLFLENLWWKKGDKFAILNKAVLTMLEGNASE